MVPHGEPRYYDLRPTLAVAPPDASDEDRALDLDGFFGFPPTMAPLLDAYRVCDLGRRRLRPGTVSVHYGAPVDPHAFPADGGEALRDHVRRLIAAQLDEVTSDE